MKFNNWKPLHLLFSIFIAGLLVIQSFSCSGGHTKQEKLISEKALQEPLIKANKKAVATEDQQIQDFIARNHWDVMETGSGLRYRIYESGTGEKAEEGKIAVIEYSVGLLNGEMVYSSDKSGPKEFLIGKGGVESGLEEGILLMKEGDRAKFIIPSHLAFGLVGDQNKIGSKTTLVYDVKLLTLK